MSLNENSTINEIETYGANIKAEIAESFTKIMEGYKCIDLGKTGNCLAELSTTSAMISKRLEPKGMLKPLMKAKNWVSRYDSVESSIENLDKRVLAEKDKLNLILDSLYESQAILSGKLKELKVVEDELSAYIDYLKSCPPDDTTGLKLQAAIHRLKIIVNTEATTKGEISKTIITIQNNKEITNQLMEASDNLIPIFKMMMFNVLAEKTNSEALKLKKSLVKTANDVIISNAKQIEQTSLELIQGREEALISPKTITEANEILQRTVQRIIDSANTENDKNLELIQSLKSSTDSLKLLDVK